MTLPPTAARPVATFGAFDVLGEVARGGQGRVLQARHRSLGKPAAIKVLHTDHGPARERFRREVLVLTRLEHRNLPRVLETGERGGQPWAAIELIAGQDLEGMLRAARPERSWCLDVVATLARALEHCHRQGVIHRDVKPANVVIEAGSERPVLIDFGLARLDPQAQLTEETLETISMTGEVLGTPAFMAPEQIGDRDGNPVGPASDVYGLGATLYFLLTGHAPFAGGVSRVLYQVLKSPPPDPREHEPGIPEWLARACQRALAKDPAERFPSAGALAEALESEGASLPAEGRGAGLGVSAAFAGLALVAAGAIALWPATPTPDPAPDPPASPQVSPTAVTSTPGPDVEAVPAGQAGWSQSLAPLGETQAPLTAGPFAILRGDGRWHALDTRQSGRAARLLLPDGAERAAWDPHRERIWVQTRRPVELYAVDAEGVATELQVETPPARGITAGPERLYLAGQSLQALDVTGSGRVLWERRLKGRIDHDPVLLDLDGDGAPEHLFVADCMGRARLMARATGETVARRRLPGPVSVAPVRDGRRLLVACTEGSLLWLDPAGDGLRVEAQLDLPATVGASPLLVQRGGMLEGVAVTSEELGLVMLSPGLRRVLWASGPRGWRWGPRGAVRPVDLDRDGTPELVSGWRRGDERTLWVCDLEGRHHLTLEGDRVVPGAPGLVGATESAVTAWGPFTSLPRPTETAQLMGRSLLAGAAAATRRHGRALGKPVWEALASYHLDQTPLPSDLEVEETVARFLRGRPLGPQLANVLLEPLGRSQPEPQGIAGRPVPFAGPWDGGPAVGVDFHPDRDPDVNGVLKLISSSEGGVDHQLEPGEELVITFVQRRAGPLDLVLEHRALRRDDWGYASFRVLLPGRTLVERWAPPTDGHLEERFALGNLPAGPQTLVIQVRAGSPTPYEVESLRLESTR